jgi:hypothetical protein
MAGTLVTDYLQTQANTLVIQNSVGATIASANTTGFYATGNVYTSAFTANTTGFYNSAGVLMIPASGSVYANVSNLIVSNSSSQSIGTLTYGATITPDFSQYNNWTVTLTGNATLANAINLLPGQSGVIFVKQDSTGGRTLSYGSAWKFLNSVAPTLTTSANSTDILVYTVETSGRIDSALITNLG